MKHIIAVIILITLYQSDSKIIGKWKIQSFGAIDNIKLSPAYTYGDAEARAQLDRLFNLMLEQGEYHFKNDTLYHSDIEHGKIIKRRAIWNRSNEILNFKEIDRAFERQAKIEFLSKDSLVILPIIEGKGPGSKLIFTKVK